MVETPKSVELNRLTCIPQSQRKGRQRQQFDITTGMDNNDVIDVLGLHDLVGSTWTVYAVSALFDFKHDDVHFKLYSKKLKEEVATRLSYKDLTYDANFSVLKNITSASDQNTHLAIKIEITGKDIDNEESKEKLLYDGMLLSWSITQITMNIPNTTNSPLLLCRGTSGCINAVHTIINYMFDCSIIPLTMNETDLNWLLPIAILTTDEENEFVISGKINMEYTIPDLVVTDTIKVKCDASALRKILMIVINQDKENTDNIHLELEHTEKFRQILHTQMLQLGGLQLGLCTLRRIELSGITIMGNRVKITKGECLNVILLYLYEKALDMFYIIHTG